MEKHLFPPSIKSFIEETVKNPTISPLEFIGLVGSCSKAFEISQDELINWLNTYYSNYKPK